LFVSATRVDSDNRTFRDVLSRCRSRRKGIAAEHCRASRQWHPAIYDANGIRTTGTVAAGNRVAPSHHYGRRRNDSRPL
jgi:hypothetical protein